MSKTPRTWHKVAAAPEGACDAPAVGRRRRLVRPLSLRTGSGTQSCLWSCGQLETDTPPPDRVHPTGVTTGCVILQKRAELPSRKQKAETMTSTPETIRLPQENPDQPAGWAFVRSLLSALVHEATLGVVNFFFELSEICSKAVLVFVFVNLCAFFIFAMGDYIFCTSAHTERFRTIINTARPHIMWAVLYLIASCWIASNGRKCRTILTKWAR